MNLAEKLTDKLIKMQIINSEDKTLYSYGFRQGFLLLLNMISVIIIGIIFHMIWQSVVFMIAYSCLRAYAGGYHANTELRCYLFSLMMVIAALWLINRIPWNGFICITIIVISSLVVLLLAPMEDANKPLDQKEKEIFKKRTNMMLSILILFALFLWFVDVKQLSISTIMGICFVPIMLILGKIKNEIREKVNT